VLRANLQKPLHRYLQAEVISEGLDTYIVSSRNLPKTARTVPIDVRASSFQSYLQAQPIETAVRVVGRWRPGLGMPWKVSDHCAVQVQIRERNFLRYEGANNGAIWRLPPDFSVYVKLITAEYADNEIDGQDGLRLMWAPWSDFEKE